MSEYLRLHIPHDFQCEMRQDWTGLTLLLPLTGQEDYQELGSAFVTLGVSLWGKARDQRDAAAAVGEGQET